MSTIYPKLANREAVFYNKSFNPNVCHVCKFTNRKGYKVCGICEINLYCSEEHKLEDELHHKPICQAIKKVELECLHHYRSYDNQEDWVIARQAYLDYIKERLSRDLKPYEVQMILFKQSCFICHVQYNLDTCTKCYSINYCSTHKEDFEHHHTSTNCDDLKLCLYIDIILRYNSPPLKKFIDFPEGGKSFDDMDSFLKHYLADIELQKYFYSDYVSGPFTLYHGICVGNFLSSLNNLSNFVVHIIAANFIDEEYLPAWELLMHILNKIEDLTIILIGSELQTKNFNIKTCNGKCLSYPKKKKFNIECYRMPYHEYVKHNSFRLPNVIVGYQANIYDWEEQSIEALPYQNCPLFFTTKSKLKADQNIVKLKEIVNLQIIYQEENKLSSKRPYRDFETNGVFYHNKFLTICEFI